MANEALHQLNAVEALRRFADRRLSPVELLRAVIDRAEVIEPDINAFSHTFFDQAMDEARRSEALICSWFRPGSAAAVEACQ